MMKYQRTLPGYYTREKQSALMDRFLKTKKRLIINLKVVEGYVLANEYPKDPDLVEEEKLVTTEDLVKDEELDDKNKGKKKAPKQKEKVAERKEEALKEVSASQAIPKDDLLSDAEVLDMFDGSMMVTKFSDVYMVDPADPKKWIHETIIQH